MTLEQLKAAMERGQVRVILRTEGADLPPHLMARESVALDVWPDMPGFHVGDEGFGAYMSFNESGHGECRVFVPWRCVAGVRFPEGVEPPAPPSQPGDVVSMADFKRRRA